MTIKCLIVDDEPLAIRLLEKHIAQLDLFEVTATCNNAIRALEILNRQAVDLLFLDIKMPELSGLDLLKTLRNRPDLLQEADLSASDRRFLEKAARDGGTEPTC